MRQELTGESPALANRIDPSYPLDEEGNPAGL